MRTEIAIMVIRIVVGVTFLIHGLDKFNGGIEGTGEFFASMGIPAPAALAVVVALTEILGGLALILGLGTRIMGIIFMIIIATAIVTVHLSTGFLGGYEFDLLLFVTLLLLVVNGSNALAVDQLIGKRKRRRNRF